MIVKAFVFAVSFLLCAQYVWCRGLFGVRNILQPKNDDPEVHMNASELITSKGYPCELYSVQTEDGFILGVQRIPHGRSEDKNLSPKPVVFLQHGLLCSSTNWITNLANESLAFLLADAGFDVWLGNVRGNTYSKRNIKYSTHDAEFWAWSWDEMARYDLPSMINFVLNRTQQKSLYYIGHSQGTLIMFAHLANNPTFAEKVKMFLALGPVTTVKDISGPLKWLSTYTPELQTLFDIFGIRDFLPSDSILQTLTQIFCRNKALFICKNALLLIAGFDEQQLNATRVPVYLAHTPAGTSVQDVVHFSQMVRSGNFQMFDYGSSTKNFEHYKQATPPLYNVTNVHVPVALFSGQNDILADPQDVARLAAKLPNIIYQQEIRSWDHLDFIWGLDAANIVYKKLIQMMKSNP